MTPLYLSSSFLTSSANLEPVEYNSDDRRVNNPSVCVCRHSRNRPQAPLPDQSATLAQILPYTG